MTNSEKILLALLRLAVNGEESEVLEADFAGADWKEVLSLLVRQAVVGIAFDALERLPEECRPSSGVVLKWIGYVSQIEGAYSWHRDAIFSLSEFYAGEGFRMMLLKGYGLSAYWPIPEHRPTGDIDIFLGSGSAEAPSFGGSAPVWKEADAALERKMGIRADNGHHHHSVFSYKGIAVENHYDFINRYSQPSSRAMEQHLKTLVSEGWLVHPECPTLYLPSDDFNALFLLKHCASHFAATQMSLRQALDYLLFVRARHSSIDWAKLYASLDTFGLRRFADILAAIGVDFLGMSAEDFPSVEEDKALVARVLSDILRPEFSEREDGTLLSGLRVKPRRFWHNRWKHALVSSDSLFATFLWSTFAKLLKPQHFKD